VDEEEQQYAFVLDEEPEMVLLDPDLKLLKSLQHPKSRSEWIYQLARARQVPARLDALDGLAEVTDDEDVFEAVEHAARHDSFREVREDAVRLLAGMELDDVREALMQACKDGEPRVREAAVDGLGSFRDPEVARLIEAIAFTDSSDRVRAACIRTLPSVDSVRAYAVASRHVYSESHRDGVRRASLNALRTLKDPRGLVFGIRCAGPEYEATTRLSALGLVRETGRDDPEARKLMPRLITHPNQAIRSSVVRTLGDWGGSENRRILEERKQSETNEDVLAAIDEALESMPGE
jgi:HEAT repeat protein